MILPSILINKDGCVARASLTYCQHDINKIPPFNRFLYQRPVTNAPVPTRQKQIPQICKQQSIIRCQCAQLASKTSDTSWVARAWIGKSGQAVEQWGNIEWAGSLRSRGHRLLVYCNWTLYRQRFSLCGCDRVNFLDTGRSFLQILSWLRVFENRVLRRVLGPKRDEVTWKWRKLHNEELSNRYSLPNIVRVVKSRRMRWAGHVARMG